MANKFTIESVFKAVDRITAPVTKMQKKIGRFTHAMERGFRRANNALTKLFKKMRSGFVRGAAVLTTAVVGVGVALKKVADRADALSKQARILDMPIEELQEWQFVAEQSGLTSETFTKALGILDRQIGQAKTGQGTLVTVLKKLNPQLLKQLMHTKDTSQAFSLLLKALHKIKDPTKRAALANAAFSKQGLKMIIVAKNTTKELTKLREEARKNGLITQKQATAAEAFNDQLNSLMHTIQGITQEALLPLLPMLKEYLVLIQKWIFANKALIKTRIQDFIRWVGEAIQFLVKHGKTILTVVAAFVSLIAVLRTFILVMTAVNIVMDLNPIGLMVLAFAALAGAIALAVTHLKELKAMLPSIPQYILDPFTAGRKLGDFAVSGVESLLARGSKPQMISPADRTAAAINETTTTNKSEVTILDATNRAAVTKGKLLSNVILQKSGVF